MNVRQFLARVRQQGARNRFRRRARGIEHLEKRCLLTKVTCDGGTGTRNWQDAANWSQDVLPGTADDVVIVASSPGSSTITFSGAAVSIRSLQSEKSLQLAMGELSVAATSTIAANLNIAGGSLTGIGNLTVSNQLTWSQGSMAGTGTTFVDGSMSITGSGSGDLNYLMRTPENRGTVKITSTLTLGQPIGRVLHATLRNQDSITQEIKQQDPESMIEPACLNGLLSFFKGLANNQLAFGRTEAAATAFQNALVLVDREFGKLGRQLSASHYHDCAWLLLTKVPAPLQDAEHALQYATQAVHLDSENPVHQRTLGMA